MNRVNKITSVFTIALFIAMWITPLLSATYCDMECCSVQMPTECGMEMETDTCCPSISECSDIVFVPFVTAPILKVNVEKDITAEYFSYVDVIPNYDKTYSVQPYYINTDTFAPPGFQIPLLV